MRRLRLGLLLSAFLLATACDLPRDADGTLKRVRGGTLRVGVIANAPWVVDSAGHVGGVEGDFVNDLARGLGAQVRWVHRPADEMMEALSQRELDLVIGGLTEDLPWKSKVAFTRPYYTDTVVVGLPPGTPHRGLKGLRVAVQSGDPLAARLRKKDAEPVPVDELDKARGAVAVPSWALQTLHREDAGEVLQQRKHVLAAAPGENAWLVYVERALQQRKDAIPARMRSEKP